MCDPFWDYFLWAYERAIYRQFVFANQRDWGTGVTSIGGTVDPYRVICTDAVDRRHQGIPLLGVAVGRPGERSRQDAGF